MAGVFAATGYILPIFGVPVEVAGAVSAGGVALMGYLSKDAGVTGTEK